MSLLFEPPTNATLDFISQLNYINSTTDVGYGGILGVGILMIAFGGVFLISKAFSFDRSYATASFIAFFVAILLRAMTLINDDIIYIVVLNLIASIIVLMVQRSNEGL